MKQCRLGRDDSRYEDDHPTKGSDRALCHHLHHGGDSTQRCWSRLALNNGYRKVSKPIRYIGNPSIGKGPSFWTRLVF